MLRRYHVLVTVAMLFVSGCAKVAPLIEHDRISDGGTAASCVPGAGRLAGESCLNETGEEDPGLCASCTCSTFVPHVGGEALSACGKIEPDANPGSWLACGDVGEDCTARAGDSSAQAQCQMFDGEHLACCPITPLTDPASGSQTWKHCAAPAANTHPSCSGMPVGTLCGGDAAAGIHGECNASGVCEWTEWTCIHGEVGDSCQGGICAAPYGAGVDNICCSWGCVGKDQQCHNVSGAWGGEPCDGQGGVP